jgi:hypothetical protein
LFAESSQPLGKIRLGRGSLAHLLKVVGKEQKR